MSRNVLTSNSSGAATSAKQRGLPLLCIAASVIGLGCTACGSSDNRSSGGSPPDNYSVPIKGCEQYSYSACDITVPECQANIFELVKCVRQTPDGTLPPITTITAAEYQDQLAQSSSNLNPDDLKRHETALVMLGLASPGDLTVSNQVSVLVNTVSAYYSDDDQKVTIIRSETTPTLAELHSQCITLAHELVHALQDQGYGLKKFHSDHSATYDANLASDSVVEGEAILYETMLRAAFDGLTPDKVNYAERFTSAADYVLNKYATDSPFLITPRVFPYFYGGPYVYLQLQATGRPGIDALFASPPVASLPYILSQTSIVEPSLNPVSDSAPAAISGTSLFADDTLGAWLTYEYLSRLSAAVQPAILEVGGWRGDHLWIYNDGTTENIAAIWRVRWSSPDEASSLVIRTNQTSVPQPNGVGSARRYAFVSNGDAVVVAVSGSFDLASWETVAASAATGSSSAGSTSGADGGVSVTGASQVARVILAPVPHND